MEQLIDWVKIKWKWHWRYYHKDFIRGIKNLIRWFKVVWNDVDYDWSVILLFLEKKLYFTKEYHKKNKRYVGWENNVKWMEVCIELSKRLRNEYYTDEVMNYHESEIRDVPLTEEEYDDLPDKWVEESEFDLTKIEIDIISEDFDSYFEKYQNKYKKIVEMGSYDLNNIKDKKSIAFEISYLLDEQNKNLLFDILKWKIRGWWD